MRLRHLMRIDDRLHAGARGAALRAWVGGIQASGALVDSEMWRRLVRIVRGG